jgi:glycerol-3-phosphate dehydrogenase
LRLTKGIHLVLRCEQVPVSRIVIMSARDRRGVFAIPHGPVTYVGTTDTFYEAPEDYPLITMDDVTYLLEAVTRTFAVKALGPDDVVGAWAGLRPLLAEKGKPPSEISRKDEIMVSPTGLLSIAGGKLTTFRRMAERIVDQAVDRLCEEGRGLTERVAASDETPFRGGATGDDMGGYAERLKTAGFPVDGDVIDHLVALYGSDTEQMLESIRNDVRLAERCAPGLPVTRAEVRYAVHQEMAMTLEDFLERRSRMLLWDPDSGLRGAETVARWMAADLGWSAERIEREVAGYRALAVRLRTFESDETLGEVEARAAQA